MEKKLISNKLLLVLSLAVAIVIWIYVIVTVDPETTAKVGPLTIQYLSSVPMQQKDIEIIGELDETVELLAKGSRSYVTGAKANYSQLLICHKSLKADIIPFPSTSKVLAASVF